MFKSTSKLSSFFPLFVLIFLLLFINLSLQTLWLDVMQTPVMSYYFPSDHQESESSLLPTINDPKIRVKDYFVAPCRFEDVENQFWGAFVVTNEYSDRWVQGEGELEFRETSGQLLGQLQLEYQNIRQETPVYFDLVVPANSDSLFLYPDLQYRGFTFGLDYQETMVVNLNFSNLEFYDTYALEDPANWSYELMDYAVEDGAFPKHELRINVGNNSDNRYYRVKISALIFNEKDELVDILFSRKVGTWQRGQQVDSEKEKEFTLQSLSRSGACIGADDDTPEHALVSIKYLNAVGTPGEYLFWIDLPQ